MEPEEFLLVPTRGQGVVYDKALVSSKLRAQRSLEHVLSFTDLFPL